MARALLFVWTIGFLAPAVAWADYSLTVTGRLSGVKAGAQSPCQSCAVGNEFQFTARMPRIGLRVSPDATLSDYRTEFWDTNDPSNRYGPNIASLVIGNTRWSSRSAGAKPIRTTIGNFALVYASGGPYGQYVNLLFDTALFTQTGQPAWKCAIDLSLPQAVAHTNGVPSIPLSPTGMKSTRSYCIAGAPTFSPSNPQQLELTISKIDVQTSSPLPREPGALAQFMTTRCASAYLQKDVQRVLTTEPSAIFVGNQFVCPGGPTLNAEGK